MIETERLKLRSWRSEDVDDFARLGSDERVMATLGPLMDRDATARLIDDLAEREERFGHTFWALERKSDTRVIGFAGLSRGNVAPIEGDLEIGWRLAHDCWGNGYAHEGAQASIDWARANRPGERIVAITSQSNTRSRSLMEPSGMSHRPDLDFDHPRVDDGDPLKPHVMRDR